MMPRISVVAPIRERLALTERMLASLWSTAANPARVEVVLRCDDDDTAIVDALRARGPKPNGLTIDAVNETILIGSRLKGYATLPTFINEAAHASHADLVLVVNDDAEFQTLGWDDLLVARAATIPDGIFNFGIETANAGNFIFPCVSRRLITLMGGVFDERLIYPDIWLRDVLMPFGRAIRVPEVVIAHHWQGQSADQQQAARVAHSRDHQQLYVRCVHEGREKVRAVLDREAVPR